MTAYDQSVRTCNDWEEGPFFLECRAKIGKMAWFPNFKFWIQRTFLADFQYFSCDKYKQKTHSKRPVMSSSDTFLESFLDSIANLPYEVKRNLDHIKTLDEKFM